jgi:hypothetical protein
MTRAHDRANDPHTTSPWEAATALCARCVEPEGDPTEVIPADILFRLVAETARERATEGGAPRFEVVELEPEDVILDDNAFESDGAFESAFEETPGVDARGDY